MNVHDSEQLLGLLDGAHYSPVKTPEEADLVIVNTCSIRDKAYHKMESELGALHRLKIKRPSLRLGVAGCAAQQERDALIKRFPHLDFVIGPDVVLKIRDVLQEVARGTKIVRTEFQDPEAYEFASAVFKTTGLSVTAFVTIMKGCDNVCSFCIVPRLRGVEVSRPPAEIVQEIRALESAGVKEITLLGQNVNSYGKGLAHKMTFPGLVRMILRQSGIPRIRYTSPHPKDLSIDLMRIYGETERLAPHIHLPVQAGSDRVLMRMRRSYRRHHYLKKINALRKIVPDIAITSDFIVGFPGETESDFQETLSLVDEVGFDGGFSFMFSSRPQTEAALFSDDVPEGVKRDRLERLQESLKVWGWRRNRALVGTRQKVLVEGGTAGGLAFGRTGGNKLLNFPGKDLKAGDIVCVRIEDSDEPKLKGVLC